MATSKSEKRTRVKRGIRRKISGTPSRPRLSVFRSNRHIYAQLIDDAAGHTLVSASSVSDEITGEPVSVGKGVGKLLAERAREAGIEAVVFDRNGFRYHGRVRAVADGAREGGLKL
ncbi:MAG: 50S ribosomal protein L18 [Rhodothermales bacterium]|nr:50S ribosomal protein L18 [Rhodothermales bacterium]MBO6781407.1 50S ribosomal protein L18 [Rhodothermales bacterium]